MADKKSSKDKVPGKAKTQTVRERSQKDASAKPKRIRQTASRVKDPLAKAQAFGRREYHIPLPDDRIGKFLGKRVRLFPKFIREAFAEVKKVTWPDARTTVRLTLAVFIFSVIFAGIAGLLDFGLDKLFKEVIINNGK